MIPTPDKYVIVAHSGSPISLTFFFVCTTLMPPTVFLLAGLASVGEQRGNESWEKRGIALLFAEFALHIDEYCTCSAANSSDQQLQFTTLAWQGPLKRGRNSHRFFSWSDSCMQQRNKLFPQRNNTLVLYVRTLAWHYERRHVTCDVRANLHTAILRSLFNRVTLRSLHLIWLLMFPKIHFTQTVDLDLPWIITVRMWKGFK